ncbi:SDR family NAD(P)-dependent oxidoreductase [Nocardia nova]|nr:SDR family NAD(P)-dependent oxidoreductase [Nocardia nova]MBV7708225.1 SDR family NAD(P)-dependent oxidoreductase [Nocardia nova]
MGLRAQAEKLRAWVAEAGEVSPVDVGWSLVTGRAELASRAVVVGSDVEGFLSGLDAVVEDRPVPGVVQGRVLSGARSVVFVFPGQGSQWLGMASRLCEDSPVFAAALEDCAAALSEFVPWSLPDVLRGEAGEWTLDRVEVVQPALWAVMVSLAALWRSFGVEPAAVVGHSQGEIAAACVAGGLSLRDGARVVALRSRALAAVAGRGGMASVSLSESEVAARLERWSGALSIAATNSPRSTAIAGSVAELEEFITSCEEDGIFVRRIATDCAGHSAQMDQLEPVMLEQLAAVEPMTGSVPFYSTADNAFVDTAKLNNDYWYRNLREPVQFERAIQALLERGNTVFVEPSAHPVLTVSIHEVAESVGAEAVATGTLRRGEGGPKTFLSALGQVWAAGVDVQWASLFTGASQVELPTYAFQRQRFWLEAVPARSVVAASVEDAAFWDAIEHNDLDKLSKSLDAFGARHESLSEVLPALRSWRESLKTRSLLNECFYQVEWRQLEKAHRYPRSGSWLVVVAAQDRPQWVDAAITGLSTSGVEHVVVELTGSDRQATVAELEPVVAGQDFVGVIVMLSRESDSARDLATAPLGYLATMTVIQALNDLSNAAPLWCVTRGAVSVSAGEPLVEPSQALTLGLGRVAASEMPERWGGLVDLPPNEEERAAALLLQILGSFDEDEIAIRNGEVFARRLVRADSAVAEDDSWICTGTAVITGGTGRIGSSIARWLAERGAPRLVLLSRRGIDAPGATTLRNELQAHGTRVDFQACDVSDRVALQRIWTQVEEDGPISAVFHAAAVLDDAPIDALTFEQVDRTIAAKAGGARNLHELAQGSGLERFVLFSALGATLGLAGQGNYAPGNTYLDALAAHRRANGLPGTSIAWGAWADGGMASVDTVRSRLRHHGIGELPETVALSGLASVLSNDSSSNVVVARMNFDKMVSQMPGATSPLVKELVDVPDSVENPQGEFLTRIAGMPESRRLVEITAVVNEAVCLVLGYEKSHELEPKVPFRDLGADSLSSIQVRNRLKASIGIDVPTTAMFDYPTVETLSAQVYSWVMSESTAEKDFEREISKAIEKLESVGTVGLAQFGLADRLLALISPDSAHEGVDIDTMSLEDLIQKVME